MLKLEEKLNRFEVDPNWLELRLPLDPGSAECERVLVECTAPNVYLVLSTPGFVEGIAADDVIEAPADTPEGFRVLRRGGNLAIRFAAATEEQAADARSFLTEAFAAVGGQLDGTMGARGLTYTVPVQAGFPMVEGIMTAAVANFPQSAWWYGNVYDNDDNPLGWWGVA